MLHIHLLRPPHGHRVLHRRDIAIDIVPITARHIDRNDLRHRRKRMTNNRVSHLPFDVAEPDELIERLKAILPGSKSCKPISTRHFIGHTAQVSKQEARTHFPRLAKGRLMSEDRQGKDGERLWKGASVASSSEERAAPAVFRYPSLLPSNLVPVGATVASWPSSSAGHEESHDQHQADQRSDGRGQRTCPGRQAACKHIGHRDRRKRETRVKQM